MRSSLLILDLNKDKRLQESGKQEEGKVFQSFQALGRKDEYVAGVCLQFCTMQINFSTRD